uniref:Soluble scavenger receptor cysteine-rich domain-containing protein SSC5D n=1 Tax=Callorhinchus milii TaxID=7868 RepID=A0A4W3GFM6_CALMI
LAPMRVLTDGLNMCSGRVEVLHNSTWGSVCGDHWGTEEANVVCRLLNCGEATSATGNATFGQGTGPVWVSDVRCEGSEAALDQCPAKPYGNNNCSHSQDASVTCSGPVPVRLVNGNNMCSGRVEVLHNSTWGSVCGDHWGTEEATVVCRLLNCGNGTSAIGNATFGQGTGPVWLSDVRCEGAETALDLCPAKPYGNTTCGHSQDIGVTCTGPHPMRLVDGDTMCSGRVEVFHNSVWGRVCGDDWDIADARVVCRQMSCGNAMSTGGGFSLGRGKGQTWLDKVKCSGDEKFLDQCRSQPWGHSNCVLGTDAAVVCSGPVPVRLVNGKNRCSGRVEIFHNSTWKSVCGDVWDSNAASIVCRQLMCGTILSISTLAKFGEGTGPIWSPDVRCNGTEAALDQCPTNPYRKYINCNHSRDSSVICSGPQPVRLANGDTICSGRVEIFHSSTWGSVCRDGWDTEDARVVCRQLSCGDPTLSIAPVSASQAIDQIWLMKVRCVGTENSLDQCPANPWGQHNCNHEDDVGVKCS